MPVWAFAAIFALLAGCTSFTPLQSSLFTDEDGNIVAVDYGRDMKEHESTFVAPNGKEMTMRSHLKVKVTLPDGDSFLAWECMNPLQTGTMYRTNNGEWMFYANGITCAVFLRTEDKSDYLEVYNGVICQGPKKGEF